MPLEPAHPTARNLDMLHQRAQCAKLRGAPARCRRAPVDLVGMHRALQVLVQARELPERAVAQHALVRAAVPRLGRRPFLDYARGVGPAGACEQARGVCDDARAVPGDDGAVDGLPGHTRGACAGLEVEE